MNPTAPKSPERYTWLVYLPVAMIVVFILFYIDEGYYDLRWMKDRGALLVYFIYVVGLFAGEVLVNHYFFGKRKGFDKILLVVVTGIPVGIVFTIGALYAWRFLTTL